MITRLVLLLILCASAHAEQPRNFLFMGSGDLAENVRLVSRPDIDGVQVVYPWKQLSGPAAGAMNAATSSASSTCWRKSASEPAALTSFPIVPGR